MSILYNRSDLVLAVTPNFARSLMDRGVENIEILPNGDDVMVLKPYDKRISRRGLGLNEDDLVIVFVGYVPKGAYYRLDVVAKAMAQLKKSNLRLLIIGEIRDPEFFKLIKSLSLDSRIIRLGVKTDKRELGKALSAADIGIVPYDDNHLWKNSIPAKFFEYCACGLPVVATAQEDSILAKIIRKEGIGIVCKPLYVKGVAEALKKLDNDRDIYFLVNISKDKKLKVKVKIKGRGFIEEWDPLNGEIKPIASSNKEGYTYLELDFPEIASYLLIKKKGFKPTLNPASSFPVSLKTQVLSDQWKFSRLDANALNLDCCQYKVGKEKWSKKLPVWKVQKRLEEIGKKVRVSVNFSFQTNLDIKKKKMYLVIENPEIFEIKVNNENIIYSDIGWWRDISFKKLDICNLVKDKGENIIELSCLFIPPRRSSTLIYKKNGVELESIYIIGDFAVKTGKAINKGKASFLSDFLIVEECGRIKEGDLIRQGYPFYAGSVIYRRKIKIDTLSSQEKIFLEFREWQTIVARVIVNHAEVGLVFWPPYQIEVSSFLKKGENLIEIELTNSLRNLLGPHHHSQGELFHVVPKSFVDEAHWMEEYNFVSFGLEEARLIWVQA